MKMKLKKNRIAGRGWRKTERERDEWRPVEMPAFHSSGNSPVS